MGARTRIADAVAARFAEARWALARGAGPLAELARLEASVLGLLEGREGGEWPGELEPPAPESAPPSSTADRVRLRPPGAPIRVLVVDDDGDATGMLVAVLGMDGCDVRVAHDEREAIAIAPRVKPELVLVDLGLPGLDAGTLAEALRRGGQTPRLVGMSRRAHAEDRARALGAGFENVLVKPVEPRAVTRLLRAA